MALLEQKIRKLMVQAMSEFNMIEARDRVLVAVSGGKDSSVMLKLLLDIREKAPFGFELEAIMVDQKQPGFDADAFRSWVATLGVKLVILEEDTYSIVKEKTPDGKTYCALCSRLRRGILYSYASNHGFSKIALGHHRDDLNETILMNIFYSGKIASMPPWLQSDDGKNIVIRPMAFVPEDWIIGYARELKFPIIPCNLCGSQEGLRRKRIKALLTQLQSEHESIGSNILTSLGNVRPSQLLDRSLWKFSKNSSQSNFIED